jgi:hypothetical protein
VGRALPDASPRRLGRATGSADRWLLAPYSCSLFSGTPGTNGDWRTGEIATLTPTDYQRDDLGHLRGKAVIHLGCHIASRGAYRRLMEARPAFLLMVDTRYPGATPLADGMFPEYTEAIGAVPTLNVAHQDAWSWVAHGAAEARCRVVGGMVPAISQNVVIDLPGTDLAHEILYASAHHDTQAESPGADDNGSGVVGVLELARLLQDRTRRRTVRLVSFGAEEQLSVGSAAYVRVHRDEVSRQGRLMYNLDSYGSHLGWLQLYLNAHPDFEGTFGPHFRDADLYYQVITKVVPYTDHFPFVAAGLPGVFHHRANCDSGRFFHHRPGDDLSRVSARVIARDVSAVATWLDEMSCIDALPFTLGSRSAASGDRVVLGGPVRRMGRALMNASEPGDVYRRLGAPPFISARGSWTPGGLRDCAEVEACAMKRDSIGSKKLVRADSA